MILVLLGISILILGIGVFLCAKFYNKYDENPPFILGGFMSVIGGVCILASIITTIVLSICVVNLSVINDKIAMYQEENTKIETQIATVVENYQEYETDIFTDLKDESAITLVSLYPELKADKLVKKQIDTYISNNNKIKELKEEKISGSVNRWWLYFGE
jgi:hypothetical protein